MMSDQPPTKQANPTIGIITALPKEFAAIKAMIDNGEVYFTQSQNASEQYYLGDMPAAEGSKHSVVLSLTVTVGTNVAAVWATNLVRDFPTVRTIIMVGIAGGVPNPDNLAEHVRLGDVVVSSEHGVVQYDFVKQEADKIVPRYSPDRPSARLLHAAKLLDANNVRWADLIVRAKKIRRAARPKDASDVLHKFTEDKNGRLRSKVIPHPYDPDRNPRKPRVFIGPIASSNTLLKDPFARDKLRATFGVKAVEMEGSGIADATWIQRVDYLVVRGICDYCDPKKSDLWQGYAAVVAAAYTRALLEMIPSRIPAENANVKRFQIQLILDGEISDFTSERRGILRDVLATILQVKPSDIRVLTVESGSVRLIVEVPEEALGRLNALSTSGVSLLVSIGVRTIVGDAFGTLNLVPDKHENAVLSLEEKSPGQDYLTRLRKLLVTHFDQEELRTLCFDLGIDYDSLRGEGQEGKVRELVTYLERRTRIPELVKYCSQLRSNVNWIGPSRLGTEIASTEKALVQSGKSLPELPRADRAQAKLDVLDTLYNAYRTDPGEKISSERIRKKLGLSLEQIDDIILALTERGFIEASYADNIALLRITADGVKLLKK